MTGREQNSSNRIFLNHFVYEGMGWIISSPLNDIQAGVVVQLDTAAYNVVTWNVMFYGRSRFQLRYEL
jgi:hypothetical protein